MANTTINNGQTCLEARGITERQNEIVRNDYTKDNEYGPTHPNALATGDVKGKGTGGGHGHWLPNCQGDTNRIDYKNFTTDPSLKDKIGGYYDYYGRNGVGGRKDALASQLYNYENQYGPTLVDTTKSQLDGQYVFGENM